MQPPAINNSDALVTLGLILLLGLATDYIGRMTRLPRVSLLFLFGFLAGPAVLDLLPDFTERWFPLITTIALVLVGFLLGGKLAGASTGSQKKEIVWYAVGITVITAVVLTFGLFLLGVPLEIAMLLGGIATATDPATTIESLRESPGKSKFKELLEGIVSLDDGLALVMFSLLIVMAHLVAGSTEQTFTVALTIIWELAGAVLLGIALGVPMAFLTGRIRAGEPTLVEALGVVLLCGGLSLYLHVSYLVASVILGYIVARWAHHHNRAFHEIEDIEWPFIILFFVLTGASVELELLTSGAGLVVAYILLRILARFVGGWLSGFVQGSAIKTRNWIGLCLLPQAGVAMGLALLASTQFPEHASTIVSVVVAATIFFEVIGPILTRFGVRKASP